MYILHEYSVFANEKLIELKIYGPLQTLTFITFNLYFPKVLAFFVFLVQDVVLLFIPLNTAVTL